MQHITAPYITPIADGNELFVDINEFSKLFNLEKVDGYAPVNVNLDINYSMMFYNCESLTSVPYACNTNKGTNFSNMFCNCSALTSVPAYDTSNGVDFKGMFYGCGSLTSVPELNTSKGTDFSSMFYACDSLTSVPELNTSNGVNFNDMFVNCYSLTSVPELDTSNGTNFEDMFNGCKLLTSIPKLDLRNATNVNRIFWLCAELTDLTLKNVKMSIELSGYWGTKLTIDSLVNTIYELHNVGESRTLTMGNANIEKLASVYVKLINITDDMRAEDDLIDNKLPFVRCESTDEGAMLITEYVGLKNWVLA